MEVDNARLSVYELVKALIYLTTSQLTANKQMPSVHKFFCLIIGNEIL